MTKHDFLTNLLGFLGLAIPILVLIYLLLKIFGIMHSPSFEETLAAIVIGQVFYSGYSHRALRDFERRMDRFEKKLGIIENRLEDIHQRLT